MGTNSDDPFQADRNTDVSRDLLKIWVVTGRITGTGSLNTLLTTARGVQFAFCGGGLIGGKDDTTAKVTITS